MWKFRELFLSNIFSISFSNVESQTMNVILIVFQWLSELRDWSSYSIFLDYFLLYNSRCQVESQQNFVKKTIIFLMLAQMCILSVFVSHLTFPHILSDEWALQETELSIFQYLDGPPPVLRISYPTSVTSTKLEVWAFKPPSTALPCVFSFAEVYVSRLTYIAVLI